MIFDQDLFGETGKFHGNEQLTGCTGQVQKLICRTAQKGISLLCRFDIRFLLISGLSGKRAVYGAIEFAPSTNRLWPEK